MDDTRDKEVLPLGNEAETDKIQKENDVMSPWAARFFNTVGNADEPSCETSETEVSEPYCETSETDNNDVAEDNAYTEPEPDEEKKKQGVNLLTLFLSFSAVIVVTVFITFFTAKILFQRGNSVGDSDSVSFADETLDEKKVAKFQDIIEFIKENYYKDYDMNELIEGAIEGLVESLDDPYGSYYSPGNMDSYTSFIEGTYTGVGFKSAACEEGMKVTEVFKDSPAEKAGIVSGDIVTAIDGVKIAELSSEEISAKLGVQGTEIKLGIKVEDGSYKEITVAVDVIKLSSVHFKELENDIKYIYISQFIDGTADEFKAALEKAAKDSCRGIVIDLRNNPGGYEKEASAVADMLLPKGTIATSRDRDGKVLKTVTSDKNEVEVPIVIIVNQNTASAAELLTGAFRDFEKGEIVGVKTYGKALAQINHVYEFDGSGIVLTTSRYYTPSGECIDGVGIEPTIKVELAEDHKNTSPLSIPAESDTQLSKAVEILEGAAND